MFITLYSFKHIMSIKIFLETRSIVESQVFIEFVELAPSNHLADNS